ncbi:lung seven transmembrane receptor-domain-containing protein [Umbelopsis sp. PMI_123]|nr:lung seven transmembrane receptor-domain-containing protein [Umbelopsis sp. PMI_123]
MCDSQAVADHLCTTSDIGTFIIDVPENERNTTSILNQAFSLKANESDGVIYAISKTGYYCLAIVPVEDASGTLGHFGAWVEWRFPYGELPAVDYPKLIFYGVCSIIYLIIGLYWAIQTFRYWNDILPVQNYISGVIFFLAVEMAFNWGYWESYNQTGKTSWGLLILVAILNAARNSISFFILLIVCMGYGVVKPSLGSTMKKCVILAATHFFFGVLYVIGTMLMQPEDHRFFLVFLVIFPLATTMTAFYIWTLNSINRTLAILDIRKQHVKALMYKRLYRLLIFSVCMVVVIFVINILNFGSRLSLDWPARNWKRRWFMLDGWLNILYFIVFLVIVILWRPTDNNARYGLEQLSQDEDEAMDLENNLRRAEGLGYDGMKGRGNGDGRILDDEAAIFELGDEESDEEGGNHVKLMSVGGSSGQSREPPRRELNRGGEQSGLLDENDQDDE